MRDSEVVAAIVAGDPDGLAEAYDRYAAPLYTYCRSLLREPADAADAVQDTFVIAASKLAGLRDQNRLRPWLYAVARNECHRRQRETAGAATSALDQVPEMSDESADVTGGAERAELRTLLRSAVRGLSASEQDLIELQLRQELDVAEIAAVLGVSRNHAHALLSRARSQLEVSLGALLVARSGRADCAALAALLEDWDGELNVLMRKRINRHIERCPACTERKRRELAPALLLGAAAVPAVAMPPGLRTRVLRLASSNTPEATAHRAALAHRAVMSGADGFPVPFDHPKPAWWRTRRRAGRGRGGGGRRGRGADHPGGDRCVRRAPQPAERAEPGLVRPRIRGQCGQLRARRRSVRRRWVERHGARQHRIRRCPRAQHGAGRPRPDGERRGPRVSLPVGRQRGAGRRPLALGLVPRARPVALPRHPATARHPAIARHLARRRRPRAARLPRRPGPSAWLR